MTTGPKPTPRNLRVVRSSDRPDRVNENEPVLPVRVPEAPDWLDPEEVAEFKRVGAILAKMRVISEADVDALAVYARNFCLYKKASKLAKQQGEIVAAPKTKVPMQNPWYNVANKAQDNWRKILTEFGLTPSSRTRVSGS